MDPWTWTTISGHTSKTPRDAMEWLQHMRDLLTQMRETACETQDKAKEHTKQWHDDGTTERHFEVNDKVLVFSPVVSGRRTDKLADYWQGPYTVLQKISGHIFGGHARTRKMPQNSPCSHDEAMSGAHNVSVPASHALL